MLFNFFRPTAEACVVKRNALRFPCSVSNHLHWCSSGSQVCQIQLYQFGFHSTAISSIPSCKSSDHIRSTEIARSQPTDSGDFSAPDFRGTTT